MRTGLDGGYITRVTLRFDLRGEELPIDAFLQLPHRVDVSDRRFDALIRRALAALGFMDPGTLPDDAWTIAPYAHAEWRWIEVVGEAELRAMVAAKLVAKKRGARVSGAEFRRLGSSYVTFEVPGEPGVRYALSEDRSVPARDVLEGELVVLELDVSALEANMRRELGATKAERPVAGVMDIGLVTLGRARLRFFYAMRSGDAGLAARITAACTNGAAAVVLVPAGRSVGDGLRLVELSVAEQLGAKGIARVLGTVAEALEIEDVEPWRLTDAEVVIERATQRVWICGVLMTALAERSYRMIESLALRAGAVVPSKDVAEHIVGKRGKLDGVVKHVRPDLLRRVEKSFVDARKDVPAALIDQLAVMEGKRGYRLGLRARVV